MSHNRLKAPKKENERSSHTIDTAAKFSFFTNRSWIQQKASLKYALCIGVHDASAGWVVAGARRRQFVVVSEAEVVSHFVSHYRRR